MWLVKPDPESEENREGRPSYSGRPLHLRSPVSYGIAVLFTDNEGSSSLVNGICRFIFSQRLMNVSILVARQCRRPEAETLWRRGLGRTAAFMFCKVQEKGKS